MRFLLAALIASFATSADAQLTCRRVEYVELKEMPVFDLSWKYCDDLRTREWARKQNEIALARRYVEIQGACNEEIGRMERVFEGRNIAKPESCRVEDLIKLKSAVVPTEKSAVVPTEHTHTLSTTLMNQYGAMRPCVALVTRKGLIDNTDAAHKRHADCVRVAKNDGYIELPQVIWGLQFNKPFAFSRAVITEVLYATPAYHAGFKKGDLLQAIDGGAVDTAWDVLKTLGGKSPGESIRAQVLRGDSVIEITSVLKAR